MDILCIYFFFPSSFEVKLHQKLWLLALTDAKANASVVMITIKLSGSLNKISSTPLGTIQTRTNLSSWVRPRGYMIRVSPGERAPWIPPLWFSLMEKSRDVRGLGTYSFLGLPEASLILRSGKLNPSTNKENHKRILRVIVAKPANPGRRER